MNDLQGNVANFHGLLQTTVSPPTSQKLLFSTISPKRLGKLKADVRSNKQLHQACSWQEDNGCRVPPLHCWYYGETQEAAPLPAAGGKRGQGREILFNRVTHPPPPQWFTPWKTDVDMRSAGLRGLCWPWVKKEWDGPRVPISLTSRHHTWTSQVEQDRNPEGVELEGVRHKEISEKTSVWGLYAFFLHQKNAFLRLNTQRPNRCQIHHSSVIRPLSYFILVTPDQHCRGRKSLVWTACGMDLPQLSRLTDTPRFSHTFCLQKGFAG